MTDSAPAMRFFYMVASTAIDAGVRRILDYAQENGLPANRAARMLAAELLFCTCLVGKTAEFSLEDLHALLDEMHDEANEAPGHEARTQ